MRASAYILALVLALAGPGIAAPQPSAANQQMASIKGVVTNAVTGELLRKAFVRLHPASGDARPATTDAQGQFAFDNLGPGTYKLEAEHAGFIDSQFRDTADVAVELRLSAGERLADLNVRLTPQAFISGSVVDEDGDIAVHANINVFRSVFKQGKRTTQGFNSAQVDDRGQFRLGGLPPGRYYLRADLDSGWTRNNSPSIRGRLQPTWYPSSLDVESSTPVILSPGQELSGLEIRLQRSATYRIRGKVSGLDRVPQLSGGPYGSRSISADSDLSANGHGGNLRPDGSFEIQGVPSGVYEVSLAQGLPRITLGHVKVQVDDRDVNDVSISVVPPHPVKGKIGVEDDETIRISGVDIWLSPLDLRGEQQFTNAQEDGSFEFAGVMPGRYWTVVPNALSGQYYLKLVRYGDAESHSGIVSLSDGDGSIELVLSTRGARVVVNVKPKDDARSPGRTAPSAARVVLIPDTDSAEEREYGTRAGVRDQNGGFRIGNIAAGAYRLCAFESVPDEAWVDAEFWKEIRSKGVELRISEAESSNAEVPLVLRSEIARLLSRLGME